MKVFAIKDGSLFSFVFGVDSKAEAEEKLANLGLEFVEAPDYVFGNWGYDETQEGDARFIKPIPEEGFIYDDKTGRIISGEDFALELSDKYEKLVQKKIRVKYTETDEFKTLREALANPENEEKQEAFAEYNEFVENAKATSHLEVYGE